MLRFVTGLIGVAFLAINIAAYRSFELLGTYVPTRFDLFGTTWNTGPVTLAGAAIFIGGAIKPLAAALLAGAFAVAAFLFDMEGKWILGPSALVLGVLFFMVMSQGLRYYCGDCGQYLGKEPATCSRCGYNRAVAR